MKRSKENKVERSKSTLLKPAASTGKSRV